MIFVSEPLTENDFKAYFALRYEVLRKPWNQPLGSERDQEEEQSFHAMAKNESDSVVGVCRLQKIDNNTGQIRFMAVKEMEQGKGIGKQLLQYMENVALKNNLQSIILHARQNAVAFYEAFGYQVIEPSYTLWNCIPHFLMIKNIQNN